MRCVLLSQIGVELKLLDAYPRGTAGYCLGWLGCGATVDARHRGLCTEFLWTFYGGTLFFALQFSWRITSHPTLNVIAIVPPMPVHWTPSTSTRRIVRSVRCWQWHLLFAVRDASRWPLWWWAWIHSHLHTRVLSSSVVHALCPCALSMLFIRALHPCSLSVRIFSSPTLWNCCPKLEHSLFHLKWRGNGERINKYNNQPRGVRRGGTNAGVVMGTGRGEIIVIVDHLRQEWEWGRRKH